MTGLVLRPERRTELAALLDDGPRLTAEYPKVAEYLDTAPMLSGTGNPEADAAFDLRFMHYMTGGSTAFGNPYWEIVGPAVGTDGERRVVNGGSANGSVQPGFVQTVLQARLRLRDPLSRDAGLDENVQWRAHGGRAGCRSWVLGATTGGPGRDGEGVRFRAAGHHRKPVLPGYPGPARGLVPGRRSREFAAALDADSVLFLCWPPDWGNTMASEALELFESRGGRRLVFMGEPKGGKTGDDAFFDRLSSAWSLESVDEQYVSWWNLADVAQGWVRQP
ncbi:hypothetical protein [Nocardia testacea]|uniref:Uncharacterized protein n=1 Tax=Nocardia testacea TaxID=248551 RepID=A0ABW7VY19_9NOCA